MKKSSELRAEAREALKGMWGSSAVMTISYHALKSLLYYAFFSIAFVITLAAVSLMGFNSFLGYLCLCLFILPIFAVLPLELAFKVGFLKQLRKTPLTFDYLFKSFNQRGYATCILKTIYTFLWSLLLIIPGIVKAYSYSMTYYVLEDNPELSGDKAIEESMRMMKGHKWQLFFLHLSFIGWVIVVFLPMCIAWVYFFSSCYQIANVAQQGGLPSYDFMVISGIGAFYIGLLWTFVSSLFLAPYIQTAEAAFYETLKNEEDLSSDTKGQGQF